MVYGKFIGQLNNSVKTNKDPADFVEAKKDFGIPLDRTT